MIAGLGGNPRNGAAVVFLDKWASAENTRARYNPLATTQPAAGATDFNSNGGYPVKNYVNQNQGIAATVQTLQNGRYPHIVALLTSPNTVKYLAENTGSVTKELRTWGTVNFAADVDRGTRSGGVRQTLEGIPAVGGQAAGAYDAAGQAAGSVADAGSAVAGFVGKLTSLSFLLRAGEVIGGAALLGMGVFLLAKQIGLAEPVGTVVGGAVAGPVGAAVGNAVTRKPAEAAGVDEASTSYYEGVQAGRRQKVDRLRLDREAARAGSSRPSDDEIPF